MAWNIRQIYHDEVEFPYVALHEVHYTSDGEIKGFSIEPIRMISEDLEGLRWYVSACEQALTEPLLILSELEHQLKVSSINKKNSSYDTKVVGVFCKTYKVGACSGVIYPTRRKFDENPISSLYQSTNSSSVPISSGIIKQSSSNA